MRKTLFVFDIETIPDTNSVTNLTGFVSEDAALLRQELEQYHLKITDGKNSFLRQPFHKIVAVSYLVAEIENIDNGEFYKFKDLRSSAEDINDEKELLIKMFEYLSKIRPRFVSFNGRNFDFPVLQMRAMLHGIQANFLYEGTKWESYTSRNSNDWHCDLYTSLADFGSNVSLKMNEVCSALGFPGKFGIDGSQITKLYDENNLATIRNYCETDVLNTYLLYCRFMHHCGKIRSTSYNKIIEDLTDFIKENKNKKAYLSEFLDAWLKSSNGNIFVD